MQNRFLCALAALALVSACSGGGSTTGTNSSTGAIVGSSSNASLSVSLIDAPFSASGATVTAVNLGITKVEAIGSGQPVILASYSSPNVVNILGFTSSTNALTFPSASIAPDRYTQFRLVLDTATTTVAYTDAGGVAHTAPLVVPSATTGGFNNNTSTDAGDGSNSAGLKVNVNFTAVAGAVYGFLLDFNAAQSIVSTGNGKFLLKPVIVATAQNIAGAISGTVKSTVGAPVAGAEVDAVQNGTTINSSVTAADGTFTINALAAGTYTLVVKNTYTTQAGASVSATGFDTNLGATVTLPTTITVTASQTVNAGTLTD